MRPSSIRLLLAAALAVSGWAASGAQQPEADEVETRPIPQSESVEGAPGDAGAAPAPDASVTYVANEGFLIEVGDEKILVDALFHDPTIDFCHAPTAETAGRPR